MPDVQSIQPDSVWVRTNPVWSYRNFWNTQEKLRVDSRTLQIRLADWITQSQDRGVRFPAKLWSGCFCHVLAPEWIAPNQSPRIVGLLCATGGRLREPEGFVTQIKARPSRFGWSVSDGLPFKVSHIQDALSKLLHSSGLPLDSVVPEACPFEISDSLGQAASGSSMNIAGLLAVIDAWNEYRSEGDDLLRCACSLVKAHGNELVSVGSVAQKLGAFKREYGSGSLVLSTDEISRQIDLSECFGHVWVVDSFEGLAEKLETAGLLQPLLQQHCLTTRCVAEAGGILERLKSQQKTEAALRFSYRLSSAAAEGGVESLRVEQRISEALEDFNRHIGNSGEAVKFSRQAVEALNMLGENASYQEILEAKSRLASALYDLHAFSDGIDLLRGEVTEIPANPRLLNAESRVMLFNTYARLVVAVSADGWEQFYRTSIRLQELVDPSSIGRTRCYLIHGLLRNNRTAEAQAELCWFDKQNIDPTTAPFVKFLRADLFRRDPGCGAEFRQDDQIESDGRGHAFGFYLQATARQAERSKDDRVDRLRRAAHVFRDEIGGYKQQNILQLFSLFLDLASRPLDETAVVQEIECFFDNDHTGKFREWYGDAIKDSSMDYELLLDRVPYF